MNWINNLYFQYRHFEELFREVLYMVSPIVLIIWTIVLIPGLRRIRKRGMEKLKTDTYRDKYWR